MALFKRARTPELDREHIPAHIAVILDGNGRGGQRRGLRRTAGIFAGAEAFRRAATYLQGLGVKYIYRLRLLTEKLARPQPEMEAIMALLDKYLHEPSRHAERTSGCAFGNMTALSHAARLTEPTKFLNDAWE